MENNVIEDIKQVIVGRIVPQLRMHGGDIELIEIKDGVVYAKLLGNCSHCPCNKFETREWILEVLSKNVAYVKDVIIENPINEDLLIQAREILKRGV